MTFFRSWFARQRQKKLDKHRIYCPEIKWTIQLPVDFTLINNPDTLFSCSHDKFNYLSAAIAEIGAREEGKESLSRTFSDIPHTTIERASSAISVGGKVFELHSCLLLKNGEPIVCFEYISHDIGKYKLLISMTYNNEAHRLKMCRCLDESHFG